LWARANEHAAAYTYAYGHTPAPSTDKYAVAHGYRHTVFADARAWTRIGERSRLRCFQASGIFCL